MPDEKEISDLLATLKDASLSDEIRRQALQQLLTYDKETRSFLRKEFKPEVPGSEAALDEMDNAYARLRQQLKGPAPVRNISQRVFHYRSWWSVAAVVLVCLGTYIFWQQGSTGKAAIASHPVFPGGNGFDTIRNLSTEETLHRLQDGSIVRLAPGSYICLKNSYTAGKKEVYLEGSAVFSVHNDVQRPFSVFVGGIEVRDLGTVFSITTKESQVRVRLIKGKVLIHPASPQLVMQDIGLVPGQEFRIDTKTLQYELGPIPHRNPLPDDHPAGMLNKELSFKNTPLEEVFSKLKKECGVPIIFREPEVKDKAFTGTLDAGSDFRIIITKICILNDLRYEIKSSGIYIHQ